MIHRDTWFHRPAHAAITVDLLNSSKDALTRRAINLRDQSMLEFRASQLIKP
jgi:hypothetical protein